MKSGMEILAQGYPYGVLVIYFLKTTTPLLSVNNKLKIHVKSQF